MQKWNGLRPPIQYLLRDFRTWLVAEKIDDKLTEKRPSRHRSIKGIGYYKTDTISWIEMLLQTPIVDHRKYVIWRILVPYLFNVKKLPDNEVVNILNSWMNSCSMIRPLDFNSQYLIKQNIRNRNRIHYLPISIHKLSSENNELHNTIFCDFTHGVRPRQCC